MYLPLTWSVTRPAGACREKCPCASVCVSILLEPERAVTIAPATAWSFSSSTTPEIDCGSACAHRHCPTNMGVIGVLRCRQHTANSHAEVEGIEGRAQIDEEWIIHCPGENAYATA